MSGEWFNAATSRKRFRERNDPEFQAQKKRKVAPEGHSDELADELWCDSQGNSIAAVERFSRIIKGYIELSTDHKTQEPKVETKLENDNKEEICIDLFAESVEIQQITKDCSSVKLPSKEELKKRQHERNKREQSVKYDEVVREKKTRENLPAHACEMCQKFYDAAFGDDVATKSALLASCSKHRYNYSPPSTPEGYWDLEEFGENDGVEPTTTSTTSPAQKQPDILIID